MELEYLLRHGPLERGVTSRGVTPSFAKYVQAIHCRVMRCLVVEYFAKKGYGGGREEGGDGRGGNAAITPTHLACPRRGHNSVQLPRTPKINAQKQAPAKKLGISSLF